MASIFCSDININNNNKIKMEIKNPLDVVLFSHSISYEEYENSLNFFVHLVYNDDGSTTKIEINKISKQITVTHNNQEYQIILINEDDVEET